MTRTTFRTSRAHDGSGVHHDRRRTDTPTSYELTGSVRWLDVELNRIVLHVLTGGAHGGAFVGSDLTFDLTGSAIHGATLEQLVPGTELRLKLRLPRLLGSSVVPELLHARSVYCVER